MKRKKNIGAVILYGFFAIFCLFNFTKYWILFFVFAALVAYKVFIIKRDEGKEQHPLFAYFSKDKKKKVNLKSQNAQKNADELRKAFSKRELKQQYKNRLEQIEKDFDFDYGDTDEDESYFDSEG